MAERVLIIPTMYIEPGRFGHADLSQWRKGVEQRGSQLTERREYRALILMGNIEDDDLAELSQALPEEVQLLLVEGDQLATVAKGGVQPRQEEDDEVHGVLKDAHLQLYSGEQPPTPEDLILPADELDKVLSEYIRSRSHVGASVWDFDATTVPARLAIVPDLSSRATTLAVDIKATWAGTQAAMLRFTQHLKDRSGPGRAERLFAANDLIWRIRALWDKMMLLAAMAENPDLLRTLMQAKSIRRSFMRNLDRPTHPFALAVWDTVHSLESYEARFRTPELHKVGRTAYWAAQVSVGEEMNRLLAYYNDLNRVIQNHFRVPETQQTLPP